MKVENIKNTGDKTPRYNGNRTIVAVFIFFLITVSSLYGVGNYSLLILTPYEFRNQLMFLALHKNTTGIHTIIKTVEDIESDPLYSRGRDIQERIKLAILHAHEQYGIQYVMLVGDVDKFPVRYTRVWDSVNFGHGYEPCDLYYADLYDEVDQDPWDNPDTGAFETWDGNGNNYFGEIGAKTGIPGEWSELNVDRIDCKPDVAVGRIPVSDSTELTAYLVKIINYEQNTWGCDWAERLMLVTGNWSTPNPTANAIADLMGGIGYAVTKHYYPADWYLFPSVDTRKAILTAEFTSGYGFVSYFGHGGPTEWSGWYDTVALDNMANKDRLPIVFAAACDTSYFHIKDTFYETKDGGVYNCTTDGELYKADATFRRINLSDGSVLFKSYNYPEYGITKTGNELTIEEGKASPFRIVPPLLPRAQFSEYWKSIRSYNFPDRFIRHAYYTAHLSEVTTDQDMLDSTFRIVPGLADDRITSTYQYVSFEAWNFPGWYLVDEGGRLVLRKRLPCDNDFDRRGTFRQIPGLYDGSAYSFESYIHGKQFIRHRNFELYIEPGTDELFRKDATFRLVVPNYDPYEDYCSIYYAYSNEFIISEVDESIISYNLSCRKVKLNIEKAAATFRLLPGMANEATGDHMTLESLAPEIQDNIPRLRSRPMYYIRHSDFNLKIARYRPIYLRDRPEPAAVQSSSYDKECLAEKFLLTPDKGAISYIGSYTGAQVCTISFVKRLFEGYSELSPPAILGDLWINGIKRYIGNDFKNIDVWLEREDPYAVGIYHTPHKMILFGDPSLRIGGIPPDK